MLYQSLCTRDKCAGVHCAPSFVSLVIMAASIAACRTLVKERHGAIPIGQFPIQKFPNQANEKRALFEPLLPTEAIELLEFGGI